MIGVGSGGDDALTTRLRGAIVRAFRSSQSFRVPDDGSATLAVVIPTHVSWETRGDRVRVTYSAEFRRGWSEEQVLDRVTGSCWDDEFDKCGRDLVARAERLVIRAHLDRAVRAPSAYLSFCEIARNPERYDQMVVTTSGIFRAGVEMSDFFDPDCPSGPDRDVSTLPVPTSVAVQKTSGWTRLDGLLDRDGRAFVVVTAVFDTYRRYEGYLPADPVLQNMLRNDNSRFGHLGFARFRLRVERIEFVSPAADRP